MTDGPSHVWVDGRLLPADGTHLSVFDRGFQLGDGVFETLRVRGGRPTELEEHLARLRRSADGLGIDAPGRASDRWIPAGIAELLTAEGLGGPDGDASIRITVSRGVFVGRGLLPPDEHPDGDDRRSRRGRCRRRPPRTSSRGSISSRAASGAIRRTRCRR